MVGGKAPALAGKAGCLVYCALTPDVEAAGLAKGFPEVAFLHTFTSVNYVGNMNKEAVRTTSKK